MKEISVHFAVIIFAIFIVGCSTTGPVNNVDFRGIHGIEDVVGTYRNIGDGVVGHGSGKHTVYLSELVWPNEGLVWHSNITEVEIQKINTGLIRIRGTTSNEEKASVELQEGRDFNISNGRVKLKRALGVGGSFKDGAAVVTYETTELGIDTHGDGKFRQSAGVVGVFFLFFPLAGENREDVRFVRIRKPNNSEVVAP